MYYCRSGAEDTGHSLKISSKVIVFVPAVLMTLISSIFAADLEANCFTYVCVISVYMTEEKYYVQMCL